MLQITIVNWNKYQTMSEKLRYPYWFRVHRDVCFSPGLHGLTASQKWLWIMFLSECCKTKTNTINVNISWYVNSTGLTKSEVLQAIEILELNNSLTVNSRSTHGELNAEERKGKEKKGENTIAQNKFERVRYDFELIYKNYPRKIGKAEGIKKAKAMIKTPEDYSALQTAGEKYKSYCISQGTEPKYIKHFSTFMNSWQDWIEMPDEIKKKNFMNMGIGEILAMDNNK